MTIMIIHKVIIWTNQSHSKLWVHYTQNSAFSTRIKMLHISFKISIGKNGMVLIAVYKGGGFPSLHSDYPGIHSKFEMKLNYKKWT